MFLLRQRVILRNGAFALRDRIILGLGYGDILLGFGALRYIIRFGLVIGIFFYHYFWRSKPHSKGLKQPCHKVH